MLVCVFLNRRVIGKYLEINFPIMFNVSTMKTIGTSNYNTCIFTKTGKISL